MSRLTGILGREGADARTLVRIYVAVVQAVLIYGLETWVMTPRIGMFWGGFHYRVAHRLTVQQQQRGGDWRWLYTPLVEEMEEAGLQEVET